MSAKLKSLSRISRVRALQCQAAIGDTIAAQRAEATLNNNAERLRSLAESAHQSSHCRNGADLHAQLELGQRLLHAGGELANALDRARQNVAKAERQRTAAYIDRETSARHFERSRALNEQRAEFKASQLPLKNKKRKGFGA